MAVLRRIAQLLALALCLLAAAALPALAQDRSGTPSAKDLWHDYPLDQGEPGPARSAVPSPAATAVGTSRSAEIGRGGGGETIAVMLVIVAVVAASAGALLLVRRHRGRPHGTGLPLGAAAGAPALGLAGPLVSGHRVTFARSAAEPPPSRALSSGARGDPAQQGGGVPPPDAARPWTAEIQWRHSGEEPRFWVVARDRRAGGVTVLARSEPLDWPPADPDAVQALVGAADVLTEALVSAGWTPLAPGTAWYERRFEWKPVAMPRRWLPPVSGPAAGPPPAPASPVRTAAPTQRFRKKSWPEGTEALWRCEIKWRSGYTRSRFEVVAYGPQRGGHRVIGGSTPFKWMLRGDPDAGTAAFRQEAHSLATALESAGWERLGTGAQWYSERFVWRHEDPPPDHVEPLPAEARPGP